jgi:hypothetical protein
VTLVAWLRSAQDTWAGALGHERGGRALPPAWTQAALVFSRSARKTLNGARTALIAELGLLVVLGTGLGLAQGHVTLVQRLPPSAATCCMAFAIFCAVAGGARSVSDGWTVQYLAGSVQCLCDEEARARFQGLMHLKNPLSLESVFVFGRPASGCMGFCGHVPQLCPVAGAALAAWAANTGNDCLSAYV